MTITMRQARKLLIPVPLIDLNFIVPILLVASLCKSVLRRLLQSFNPSTLQSYNVVFPIFLYCFCIFCCKVMKNQRITKEKIPFLYIPDEKRIT